MRNLTTIYNGLRHTLKGGSKLCQQCRWWPSINPSPTRKYRHILIHCELGIVSTQFPHHNESQLILYKYDRAVQYIKTKTYIMNAMSLLFFKWLILIEIMNYVSLVSEGLGIYVSLAGKGWCRNCPTFCVTCGGSTYKSQYRWISQTTCGVANKLHRAILLCHLIFCVRH